MREHMEFMGVVVGNLVGIEPGRNGGISKW